MRSTYHQLTEFQSNFRLPQSYFIIDFAQHGRGMVRILWIPFHEVWVLLDLQVFRKSDLFGSQIGKNQIKILRSKCGTRSFSYVTSFQNVQKIYMHNSSPDPLVHLFLLWVNVVFHLDCFRYTHRSLMLFSQMILTSKHNMRMDYHQNHVPIIGSYLGPFLWSIQSQIVNVNQVEYLPLYHCTFALWNATCQEPIHKHQPTVCSCT